MVKILHKYIAKMFLYSFAATFFSLAGLSLLVDIIEMLRKSSNLEISFITVFAISLTKLPFLLLQILPFCVIIATVITFWIMSRSSELIIYRAVGVSAKNFISPVLATAFLIGLFATTIFNPLAASMYDKHNNLLEKNGFSFDNAPFLAEDGLWFRETKGDVTSVIYTKNIILEDEQLKLNQLSIINLKDDYLLKSRIEGKIATIKDNKIHLPSATVYKIEQLPKQVENYELETSITINQLQENMASLESISFWEMPSIISFFEKTGFSVNNYKSYYYSLLAMPFLLVAFVLAAAPFMLMTNIRKSNMFFRILLAIVSGFILFFFAKISMAFGGSSSIPVSMSVIIPIAITSFCGFAAILHYEDG